jgi:L,D-peptidoglycan transpeptidase YkuD (ErfK/YbiS/YcfS/YnhG family)
MVHPKAQRILLFLIVVFFCSGPQHPSAETMTEKPMFMQILDETSQHFPLSSQIIIVESAGPGLDDAKVVPFKKRGQTWREALSPMAAKIGRKGFAPKGEKREGDGRTPQGTYRLGFAFGYGRSIHSKMPYRQMTSDDIWVDDLKSPDYNRLVRRGATRARSFEDMVFSDHRYKYGIVVEYNTEPVVPGHGSAIFIHVWKDAETPTSGCIALSEQDILKLLRFLDPAKKPVIALGNKTVGSEE